MCVCVCVCTCGVCVYVCVHMNCSNTMPIICTHFIICLCGQNNAFCCAQSYHLLFAVYLQLSCQDKGVKLNLEVYNKVPALC